MRKILNKVSLTFLILFPLMLMTIGLCLVIPQSTLNPFYDVVPENTDAFLWFGLFFIMFFFLATIISFLTWQITYEFTEEEYLKNQKRAVKFGILDKTSELQTIKVLTDFKIDKKVKEIKQQELINKFKQDLEAKNEELAVEVKPKSKKPKPVADMER